MSQSGENAVPGGGRVASRPRLLECVSATVRAADGRILRIEHAGVWDPPEGDHSRSGCYYEDDHRPPGCVSLYRIAVLPKPKRWWQR